MDNTSETCACSGAHLTGCIRSPGKPIGSGATLRVVRGNRHHGLNKGEKWRVYYLKRVEGQTTIGVERHGRQVVFFSQRIPRYGAEFNGHRGDPTRKVRFCSI